MKNLAWLWAFLAFLLLAVVSIWREVPLVLPPSPDMAGPAVQRDFLGPVAVLPFADSLVASPYAVGLDSGKPTQRMPAVQRGSNGLICSLDAAANHVGPLDGKAYARLLAGELAAGDVFASVRYVDGVDELRDDETLVLRGRVLDSGLWINPDGSRKYELGVEIFAERSYAGGRNGKPWFWRKIFRKSVKGGVKPAVYEVGEAVRALYGDVERELGEAVRKQP
jgi:hypothetical protein